MKPTIYLNTLFDASDYYDIFLLLFYAIIERIV